MNALWLCCVDCFSKLYANYWKVRDALIWRVPLSHRKPIHHLLTWFVLCFFLRRVGILEVYTGHSWIGRGVWKSWWSFNLRKFDPVTRKAVVDSRINSNRLSTVMLCACIECSRYSSQTFLSYWWLTYCSGILLGFVFFFCLHALFTPVSMPVLLFVYV